MSFSTILFVVLAVIILAAKAGKAVKKSFPAPQAPDGVEEDWNENVCDSEPVENNDADYFSYENISGNTCFTESESSASIVVDSVEKEPASNFDLRQAVVYNAILHNDYIESRR